jgi:hypothetical protein
VQQEQWSAVDEYVAGLLAPHDSALEAALSTSEEAGLRLHLHRRRQGEQPRLLRLGAGAFASRQPDRRRQRRSRGTLADSESDDPKVLAQRRLHEMVAAEDRVSATTIQTVGSKGYDGFTIALVK